MWKETPLKGGPGVLFSAFLLFSAGLAPWICRASVRCRILFLSLADHAYERFWLRVSDQLLVFVAQPSGPGGSGTPMSVFRHT